MTRKMTATEVKAKIVALLDEVIEIQARPNRGPAGGGDRVSCTTGASWNPS
jgi:hypothetical protein